MKTEQLLGIAIPVLYLTLLALEHRLAARQFAPVQHWRKTGIAFLIMVLLVGSVTPLLLPLAWFKQHPLFDLQAAGVFGIPIGLLATTFVGYWFHRAEHRFDWLWRASHQLHHSQQRVDIAGAFYAHPVEVIFKVAIGHAVGIWLLGLDTFAAALVGLLSAILSMLAHWNVNTPHWLGFLIPRPESHLLHHERGVHARNYGDLPIWDMLFGTFANPRRAWRGQTGFDAQGDGQLRAMLLMRDVNAPVTEPGKRAPGG